MGSLWYFFWFNPMPKYYETKADKTSGCVELNSSATRHARWVADPGGFYPAPDLTSEKDRIWIRQSIKKSIKIRP